SSDLLAERLRAAVRGNDYVARLGGDDFAVLLPSADEASVRAAAERAVSAIATPFRAVGRDIRLEASAGVAMFPRDAVELDGLLQRAELALERAKRARRTVAFYRRESDAGRHSLYLESDLRTAIEREELDIVYQPICYLPTGEILGLEALTRWEHPTRGRIAPSTFSARAGRRDFIGRLARWTLREATAQLAAWCRLGSNVIVTVNLAAQTLSDPGLPAYIEELLAETGAPPDLLALEVTERTALDDFETSAGVLMRLRETGVGVALDDFGRGYSSLATLDRLPISFLKLDASFTQGIGASLKDEHLLRAVKLFTKGIGIPFVAEGIETESQRTWLIRQGVRFGQGYLFSRPTARENIVPPRGVRANARLAPPMAAEQTGGQNWARCGRGRAWATRGSNPRALVSLMRVSQRLTLLERLVCLTRRCSMSRSTNVLRGVGRRVVTVALLTAAAMTLALAAAQALPENAAEAIERGEALVAEALATYDAQYPDRPLWRQAFAEGRTAIELAPGHPEPLRFLARAYSLSNWHGPAVDTWREFLAAGGEFAGDDAELFGDSAIEFAFAAYQVGNLELAAERYAEIVEVLPDHVEAHRWLGRILLELRLPEQAIAAWRTVVELEPGSPGAEYFLELSQAQA